MYTVRAKHFLYYLVACFCSSISYNLEIINIPYENISEIIFFWVNHFKKNGYVIL